MTAPTKNITRLQLAEAIRQGEIHDYNRQLLWGVLDTLDTARVELAMLHHHKHLENCEPHARLMVSDTRGKLLGLADVPISLYNGWGGHQLTAAFVSAETRRVEAEERTVRETIRIGEARGDGLDRINAAVVAALADLSVSIGE